MFEVGRVVYKIAGRDSNQVGVIVEKIDDRYVLIDGNTRRKKVNVAHIEPTQKVVDIKKGATSAEVAKALTAAGFVVEKKGDSKKTPARKVAMKQAKKKASTSATSEAKTAKK